MLILQSIWTNITLVNILDSALFFHWGISSNTLYAPSFQWHPSRTGNFYFAFYNGTAIPCQQGQKLAVKITSTTSHSPAPETQPPETPGGVVASSPSYPWPFQPREKEGASPGPAYTDIGLSPYPAISPAMGSIPFINSNPAVPLPTGEVDSATIRPLPTSADHTSQVYSIFSVFRSD